MPLYRKGQPITVHHGKPWKPGKPIQMRGHVAACDGELVRMTRRFQSPGRPYDGLYATQRRGDHGTIELPLGAWVARRRYLRQSGSLIGELYNIQTPIEFHPREVRYVDLEIDVAYLPHRAERVQVQDVAEMEAAVARGYIPGEVAEVAREVAEELARRLEWWDGESALEWDVRPEPARLTLAVEDFLHRALTSGC
ncbi:DUF402 domain-containing protein [Archangium lipolyticum]|uniref:DUF402 domain-containing protein n=1 Tax=Archangium lipolyticum TaxID=2970465 RepID=UPI00214A5BCB|nr:DUF402 domain-containing protein [Archangium lipolyticum]